MLLRFLEVEGDDLGHEVGGRRVLQLLQLHELLVQHSLNISIRKLKAH